MKKRIKLRAMTDNEFCRTQKCETCPEFFQILGSKVGSRCALYIKWRLTGQNRDCPYRDENGRYILVRADD